jgi:AraC family transcriptional regulator
MASLRVAMTSPSGATGGITGDPRGTAAVSVNERRRHANSATSARRRQIPGGSLVSFRRPSLNSAAAQAYRARFRKVLEYIDAHLDDDLSVERLSAVAAFSKYHFHRQFTELFGIGVYKYLRLMRLKRASKHLAFHGGTQISDIALASGYEGPEAFSRAFKKILGQSPSEFRREPQWARWHAIYEPLSELRIHHMSDKYTIAQVEIIDFTDTKVAALEHRGDPKLVGNTVRKFIEWRKQNKLSPQVSATFNVFHDNPTETDDCRIDICAATQRDVADNPYGVTSKTVPGGRCAVLRHIGTDDTLGEAVTFLYAQWLPQSDEELRDFPLYFRRVSFFPLVPEHEAVTDVLLPLK